MATDTGTQTDQGTLKLATFRVGDALCGIDILHIQEINKLMDMTAVPQSPDYVRGILNLRGKIVTVIDLRKKLGLVRADLGNRTRNIIVAAKGEAIGLLVSDIGDVVATSGSQFEPPPANIGEIQGKYFSGVTKTEKQLIGMLDLEQVLSEEE